MNKMIPPPEEPYLPAFSQFFTQLQSHCPYFLSLKPAKLIPILRTLYLQFLLL